MKTIRFFCLFLAAALLLAASAFAQYQTAYGLYEDWTPQERRGALDCIQDMSKQIGGSIERSIAPQQRARTKPARQTR